MARFRWRRHKGGTLQIKGRAPAPDPRNRRRIIGGCSPRMLQFRPDGADGIYDTDDPWEIEAMQATLPWKRGMLRPEGALPGPRPAGRPAAPVAVVEALAVSSRSPLPWFEEPETLDDLLAIL